MARLDAAGDRSDAAADRSDAARDRAARAEILARSWRAAITPLLAAGDPEALLTTLKDASEVQLGADPRLALDLAELLILGAEIAALPRHSALGRMARGDALRNLGRHAEALVDLEAAGEAFLALGDRLGWARTRTGWLVARHYLQDLGDAFAVAEEAQDLLLAQGERFRAAGLAFNLGVVRYERGELAAALAALDRALAIYAALDAPPETSLQAARVRATRALVIGGLGELAEALEEHRAAQALFEDRGQTLSATWQDINVAYVHMQLGDYAAALRRLYAVRDRAREADQDATLAWAAIDMAECYLNLASDAEALDRAEEAMARFEAAGAPTEAAKAALFYAQAQARLGDAAAGLGVLEEAEARFEAAGLATQQGMARLLRAILHRESGDAETALIAAEAAGARFAERGLVIRRAQAEIVAAQALLDLGRAEAATGHARAGLAVAEEQGVPELAQAAWHALARAQRAAGRPEAALEACEAAIARLDGLQSGLTLGLQTRYLGDKLGAHHEAIALALELDQAPRAFALLERAKARALQDYLAVRPRRSAARAGAARSAWQDRLDAQRRRHHGLYRQLHGEGLDPNAPELRDEATRAQLQAALGATERAIQATLNRMELEGIADPGRPRGATVSLEAIRAALPADTPLLAYYLGPERAGIFVLDEVGLGFVPLGAKPAQVQAWAAQWEANRRLAARLQAAGADLGALERRAIGILGELYRALIGPVAQRIEARERLVLVPYGFLHGLPFGALHDGRRFLAEDFELWQCPAAGLLPACAVGPPRAPTTLVLGHSHGGRLPQALAEARAVAELLPGECHLEAAATVARLVEAAPRHGILHLATHGEARLDNPSFACLRLEEGLLYTSDLADLDLAGALVVLSGCETGRGRLTGADEVVSLSRGFLAAGARALVQSLWQVDDAATAALMVDFYRALAEGRGPAAALGRAQRDRMAQGARHPFLWAAFQVIGQGGPLPSSPFLAAPAATDRAQGAQAHVSAPR